MRKIILAAAAALLSAAPAYAVTSGTKVFFEQNEGRTAAQANVYGFLNVTDTENVGGINQSTTTGFGSYGFGETHDSFLVLGETANGADGFRFTFDSAFKVTLLAYGEPGAADGGTSEIEIKFFDAGGSLLTSTAFNTPPAFVGPLDLFGAFTGGPGSFRIQVDGITPRPDYDLLVQAIPVPLAAPMLIGALAVWGFASRRKS